MKAPQDETPKGWIDWNGEEAKRRAAEEARRSSKNALFSTEEGRTSRLLTGLITAVAGVPSILIGLGLWTTHHVAMAAPLTIILCMGVLFVGGGLSFAMGFISPTLEFDGSLPKSTSKPIRVVQAFLSASAAAGFAGVATWLAMTGGMHSAVRLLEIAFAYIDPAVLEARLNMWLRVLAALLWIFALIGIGRGLWRMYETDAEKSSR